MQGGSSASPVVEALSFSMETVVLARAAMKMQVCVVTSHRGNWTHCVDTWGCQDETGYTYATQSCNDGNVVGAMQALYLSHPEADMLFYGHDDLLVRESNWQERVLKQFEDPKVGVVGFGGSIGHGDPDIYKKPYDISQLGRSLYMSNVDNWETHGSKFEGECDVATLDGFALIVRRELLAKCGGWPVDHLSLHGYDHWLTCMAHRHGYRVRLVGIRCHHLGGRTSTRPEYHTELEKRGTTDAEIHSKGHRWIYEECRDCLPWFCQS